jgi:hypothetical protein
LLKSKVQEELNALLVRQGFDFAAPDPAIAWRIFKEFVQIDLPGHTTIQIGYECLHVWDRDDVLWLQFAWHFEGGVLEPVAGCLLAREVPREMAKVSENLWWSPEQESNDPDWSLEAFFAAVEDKPEFKLCMELGGWRWTT